MEEGKEQEKKEEAVSTDNVETQQPVAQPVETKIEEVKPEPKKEPKEPFNLRNFYEKNYKKLLLIPIILLTLSLISIGIKTATTGEFINKDVSLKGGVTITIPLENEIDTTQLQSALSDQFNKDITVRSLREAGEQIGISIAADINGEDQDELDTLLDAIKTNTNLDLENIDYSVEIVGSSLGESFFRETIIALLIAFLFMGLVVLLYFRIFIPSIAVVLSAFSDIVVTLAVVNLLGIKIGTAGIAAFLMLIGYSVDTNILLTTRILKRKQGSVTDRYIGAIKTGLTMTLTTLSAVVVALIFSQSEVIRQIMIILLIGLLVDTLNTWLQNAGILRLHLERKK